jgi:hypothetical protein
MPQQPHDHYNDGNKEHEQRDAVHAMHKLYVYILRVFRIPFTQIEISKYLLPDGAEHGLWLLNKVTKKNTECLYLQP